MSGKVIRGPYGMYYAYKDENGAKRGLSITDNVYERYYEPGYLTDSHIEDMLQGKTISFKIPTSAEPITAKLVPYTRNGRNSKIIEFSVSPSEDNKDNEIIYKEAENILKASMPGGYFDYRATQKYVNSLKLTNNWTTFARYNRFFDNTIYLISIELYIPRMRGHKLYMYGLVDTANNEYTVISEDEYNKLLKAYTDKEANEKSLAAEQRKKAYEVILDNLRWMNDLVGEIWPDGSKQTSEQLIESIEKVTAGINVSNMQDRLLGLTTARSTKSYNLNAIFDKAEDRVRREINVNTYTDENMIRSIRTDLLENIKVYAEYLKLNNVRHSLYKQYQNSGLDGMTASIDIDTALSLGYFPMVKQALVKYRENAPKYIIYEMHKDILDAEQLKVSLLNLLKIFYDFYDMPEKDRKAIAKYVAVHKLSEYYEAVSQFDDVLEVLIDNSRDPKLTKPLLESIAGTSKANVLKDKTFYFEKRGYLRNDILLYKPIELVEELRKCIKEFNTSSNVAILTNIELDSDRSFIFQFYTFAEGEGNENGFDGRRMLNLTRIYNRHHPKEKIGFNFNNDDSSDDDE